MDLLFKKGRNIPLEFGIERIINYGIAE